MAKKKFNVKGVEAGGDFVEAPIGLYVGKIVEPKLEKPKDKDERVHVQIELQGKGRANEPLDPPKGSRYGRLHDYVNLESEAAAFKVMQYLIAIGKVDPDDEKTHSGSVDWEKELDGQLVLVRVKHEPYDGESRAKPGNVMPYDEDDAGDPDDEDDDDDSTDDDDESGDEDDDDESGDDGDESDDDDEDESSEDDELWTEEELKELDTAALKEEAFNATDDEDNPGFGFDKKKFLKKKGDKKILDKAKVIKAILDAQEAKQSEPDDGDDGDDEAEDYSSWDEKKLKAELKERELTVKGKFSKAKAVKALKADDEEDPF